MRYRIEVRSTRNGAGKGSLDIQSSRGTLEQTFAEYTPAAQRLLRFAGLDPDHALARWGNHDRTFLLPATVFEIDDTGALTGFEPTYARSGFAISRSRALVKAYFQVPDRPELTNVVTGTGAMVVERLDPDHEFVGLAWARAGPHSDLARNRPG